MRQKINEGSDDHGLRKTSPHLGMDAELKLQAVQQLELIQP